MVKSGLTERTFVSHYRLGIHLVLAFFIFSYLLWLILTMQDLNSAAPAQKYTGNKSSFLARKSSA
jgi:cytochrome c oxidase assembly protein subunit 15